MPNPTPTPAPALTDAIIVALYEYENAAVDLGDWRKDDSDEPLQAAIDRTEAARIKVYAAITAALAQGAADAARLDWLSAHDHWMTESGLAVWTARIETGVPEDDMADSGLWDIRRLLDRARTALDAARAGEASHG